MLRMKYERLARGLTRRDVYRAAAIYHMYYPAIEDGRMIPTEAQLKAIAAALGVPESEAHTLTRPIRVSWDTRPPEVNHGAIPQG